MAKSKRKKRSVAGVAPSAAAILKTDPNYEKLIWSALHYAQYDLSDKVLKKSVIDYAKQQGLAYKNLSALPDKRLLLPGKYAWILVNGGELPDNMVTGFARLMDELLRDAKEAAKEKKSALKEKKKEAGPVMTVQDRMREQAIDVAVVMDQWLDDLALGVVKKIDPKVMDPASQLRLANFKAGQARHLKSFYESELAEWQEVVAGKDADLKEGYSNVKKVAAKRVVELLENIIQAATMLEKVSKVQRKTRKAKPKSVTKQVEKLKYLAKSDELGIVSENPINLIGAMEVWVYNTKYRKLGKYIAADAAGIYVKGTTLQNYSAASVQKTLRKPKEQLKEFNKAGKVKLRKFLDEIKAVDTKLNGRMNENIVILKVTK